MFAQVLAALLIKFSIVCAKPATTLLLPEKLITEAVLISWKKSIMYVELAE